MKVKRVYFEFFFNSREAKVEFMDHFKEILVVDTDDGDRVLAHRRVHCDDYGEPFEDIRWLHKPFNDSSCADWESVYSDWQAEDEAVMYDD